MKGYGLALGSVVLVSAAQLLLRAAMTQLPAISALTLSALPLRPVWLLLTGLGCYGLSMGLWIQTLRYLPLNRACPLLSLSYVLVWALAMVLPIQHETFHPMALAGVLLIMLGLLCLLGGHTADKGSAPD